jgi:hypothetical protein
MKTKKRRSSQKQHVGACGRSENAVSNDIHRPLTDCTKNRNKTTTLLAPSPSSAPKKTSIASQLSTSHHRNERNANKTLPRPHNKSLTTTKLYHCPVINLSQWTLAVNDKSLRTIAALNSDASRREKNAITHLNLAGADQITDAGLSSLVVITTAGDCDTTDANLNENANTLLLSNLRELNLRDCYRITSCGLIQNLLRRAPKLRTVVLDGCLSLTSKCWHHHLTGNDDYDTAATNTTTTTTTRVVIRMPTTHARSALRSLGPRPKPPRHKPRLRPVPVRRHPHNNWG